MKLTITQIFNKYTVYQDKMKVIGIIRKIPFRSGQYKIYDGAGKLLYSIQKNNQDLAISGRDMKPIICSFYYKPDKTGNPVQTSLFRPPLPQKADMDTGWGKAAIVKTPGRAFKIYLNQEKIGELTHMLSHHKELTIHSHKLPPELYLAIFSIGLHMLDRDMADIV